MAFPLRSLLTGLAMVAFAGNSLLCRLALERQGMDAATFTLIRLLSGSVMLALLAGRLGSRSPAATPRTGSWAAALGLLPCTETPSSSLGSAGSTSFTACAPSSFATGPCR